MKRTSILWATLAFLAVVSLAENVSACRWRSGSPACHSECNPPSSSATIVVRLPADARLFFDDQPTTTIGPTRFFTTPPLNPGCEFTYKVRAEATHGGQRVTMTKQVAVRAFSTTEVDFGDMTSAVGSIADLLEVLKPAKPPAVPADIGKLLGLKPGNTDKN